MGKITIKELCDKLKADPNEKSLFFKELSAEEFLVPFRKESMFDFTDGSSYWAIQYLERIYSKNTKDTILEIINENIKNNKIDDIHYSTYYQLVKLLDKFELPDLNKIDYVKLLKHKQAIELVKNIYKKEQIIEYENLIKATISTLLEYKIKTTSFDKRAEVIYETYYLSKIINGDTTKKNFQTALSQEFLFDYLVEKYNEVYFKTHENLNEISDVFRHQKIDMEKLNKGLINDYSINDVADIILYFLCVNLNSGRDVSCNIKKLLSQKIFILRKLGLYFIYEHLDKYIDLLKEFFKHINKRNIVRVTDICLYELVKIFENINKIDNSDSLDDDIKVYLDKFPRKGEKVKYDVLHGLKEHKKFKSQFYQLKDKFDYEKDNPGIYWQEGIGGWVRNVSPISEEEFRSKPIKEQIEYINSDIKYNHHLVQVDKESVEEVNERGLIDLFKKVVSGKINDYIEDANIININKIGFIRAYIESLSKNIEKIKAFNKVILFIDNIFNFITQNPTLYNELLYELIDFNFSVVTKRHKDFKKIFKYIKWIANNDYEENYYKNEFNISIISLNTTHGRNFRCYMEHLTKIRKLNNEDKTFLEYILLKENENRLFTFYYHLGMQYEYLSCKFNSLNLLERVYKLNPITRKYFLNGYLAYFRYLPQFKELKTLILSDFKEGAIKDTEVRTRFVRMLLDLKLKLKEDKIFEEFCTYFSEQDYKDILNILTYRDNPNYHKEQVMSFWNDVVKLQNKAYTCALLSIFNKYCDINDFEYYEKQLKSIIKLGLPQNLIAISGVSDFLEKLLCYLKVSQNSAIVYNVVIVFISSLTDVEYLSKEVDVLSNILNEFEKQNKIDNARLIAEKMYKIPCLKFHAKKYEKFLT